jgi:hypothetical protein
MKVDQAGVEVELAALVAVGEGVVGGVVGVIRPVGIEHRLLAVGVVLVALHHLPRGRGELAVVDREDAPVGHAIRTRTDAVSVPRISSASTQ